MHVYWCSNIWLDDGSVYNALGYKWCLNQLHAPWIWTSLVYWYTNNMWSIVKCALSPTTTKLNFTVAVAFSSLLPLSASIVFGLPNWKSHHPPFLHRHLLIVVVAIVASAKEEPGSSAVNTSSATATLLASASSRLPSPLIRISDRQRTPMLRCRPRDLLNPLLLPPLQTPPLHCLLLPPARHDDDDAGWWIYGFLRLGCVLSSSVVVADLWLGGGKDQRGGWSGRGMWWW